MESKIKTLVSWDTELSADSVEWCPFEDFHHVFVCGTYQIKENEFTEGEGQVKQPTLRHGRLYLMALVQSDEIISRLQTIETSAVLDCKWAPQLIVDKILLAVVNANGQLCIYKLTEDDSSSMLELREENNAELPKQQTDSELLALSLSWSIGSDGSTKIATSDSKGRISVFRLEGTIIHLEVNWTAHSFEAWIVHFNPFNSHICYTGGDDCKLRVYDLRCNLEAAIVTNSTHSSGVTSLICPQKTENMLLSGSYDKQVLLWDSRQMKRPINNVNVGGGVWRIRFEPHSEQLILLACMYNGFRLLNRNLGTVAEYTKEHQSIGYGADWSYLSSTSKYYVFPFLSGKQASLIATCSFYDHKLCVSLVSDELWDE